MVTPMSTEGLASQGIELRGVGGHLDTKHARVHGDDHAADFPGSLGLSLEGEACEAGEKNEESLFHAGE